MRETIATATLKEFLDAFNAHDPDAIMEFFADNCEFCLPRGKGPWGIVTHYGGSDARRLAEEIRDARCPTAPIPGNMPKSC
jgi:hypothetical protein